MMSYLTILLGWINPVNWIKWIYKNYRKARLRLYYDSSETYHKVPVVDVTGNPLGLFVHVMVKNIGKETALKCVGELVTIEILRNGKFELVREYRNIMQLKWAHENDFSEKDIDFDEPPRRLDVCYTLEGFNGIHFFTKKYPNGSQTDFGSGTYRIKIKIKSENAKSVSELFVIKYEQNVFDSLRISDYKEV